MTFDPGEMDERLHDLLTDRALRGLSAEEEAELDVLLASCPGIDVDALDRIAAMLDRAYHGSVDMQMPESLKETVASQARQFFASRDESDPIPSSNRTPRLAWLLAAAAIVLAVAGWWPRLHDLRAGAEDNNVASSDEIRIAWAAGPDAAGADVTGEIVWSTVAQRGEMTFRGLAANDPAIEQYQLWIFDRNQSEATPIDGGVFDVSDSSIAKIAIDPKLTVVEPYLFAVTVEKPGGVVVSSRERIATTAAVP